MAFTRNLRRSSCIVAALLALASCGAKTAEAPAPEAAVETGPAATDGTTEIPVTEAPATDPGAASTDGPVCSLVTQDEVTAALGNPATAGVAGEEDGVPICTWESTVPSTSSSVSSPPTVKVALLPYGAADQEALASLTADADNTVIDGLGDQAVAIGGNSPGPLFVVVGNQYLQIALSNYARPDDYSRDEVIALLTAIGQAAAPRLP